MFEAQQPTGEIIRLKRGRLLYDQRRYDDAIAEFQGALAEDPNNASAHVLLAMSLLHLERWTEATESARTAVGLDPASPQPHYALGLIYESRNMLEEALECAETSLACDPGYVPAFALGARVYLRQKKYDKAIRAASKGLELDPDDIECTNLLAAAQRGRGDHARARASVTEALRRDPDNTHSHANMGWQALHAGDHETSLEHFRESLRLDPTNEWARAGIIEAVKAQFVLYRLVLAYFLWVSRLRGKYQIGLVLGLVIGINAVNRIGDANPTLEPFTNAIVGAYGLFVLTVWIARPLSSGVLALSRFGRLALPAWDRSWGLIVLTLAIGGIVASAAAIASLDGWVGIAISCALYLLVLSGASTIKNTTLRPTAIALASLLGVVFAVGVYGHLGDISLLANGSFLVLMISAVASTWIASGMSMMREPIKR